MVTTKKMEYHRVHALACGKQVEVTAVVLDSRFTRYCVSMLPTEHRQLLMLLAFHVAGLFMVAIPNTARKQIAVKYNMHYMMYFFASLAAGAFTTSNIAYVGSQPCNGQAAAKNLAATGARDMAALALRQSQARAGCRSQGSGSSPLCQGRPQEEPPMGQAQTPRARIGPYAHAPPPGA